jgi:hypothetical protein
MVSNQVRNGGTIYAMPEMDDGPTDGPPGKKLKTALVHLTIDEAYELLESLKVWAEEIEEEGYPDPGWHMHVTDDAGHELTISIGEPEADGRASEHSS